MTTYRRQVSVYIMTSSASALGYVRAGIYNFTSCISLCILLNKSRQNSRVKTPVFHSSQTLSYSRIFRHLWRHKIHYRVHKALRLVLFPKTNESSPHLQARTILRHILIFSSLLPLSLPIGLLPSGLPTKIMYGSHRTRACRMLNHESVKFTRLQ